MTKSTGVIGRVDAGTTPAHPVTRRRTDIQGLRALAVGMVVVYHFFPSALTGGFVGVDVFFVISGFLITLLLFREIDRTGRVSLSAFYARRVRRLLPAALVTMTVTVIAASLIVGPIRLVEILRDMAWTTAYLANYHFAQSTTGYFDTTNPSPFLHYWSLAVEEQYYLLWPLVLVLTLLAGRSQKKAAGLALLLVFLGSLTASVLLTGSGSLDAYYSLGTRAWELAIGGILAFIVFHKLLVPSRALQRALPWAGVLLIGGSAVLFTGTTPFPGWTAMIPTVGTALIIWAGSYSDQGLVHRTLSIPPAQFLGNISYSLYLWHWPVLILGVAVIESPSSWHQRLVLVAIALGLAIVSFFLVERKIGGWRRTARSRSVIATGLALTLVFCAGPAAASTQVPTASTQVVAEAKSPDLELESESSPVTFAEQGPGDVPTDVPANLTPSLGELSDDLAEVFTNGCYADTVTVCEGGDPAGERSVVLAGDSHAGQWWPAINKAAKVHGWKLYLVGKNGCPLADVEITRSDTSEAWPSCATWQKEATASIVKLDADLIVYANHAQGYRTSKKSLESGFLKKWEAGVSKTLGELTTASPVLFMGQSPVLLGNPGICLAENIPNVQQCSTKLEQAVTPDLRKLNETLAARAQAVYFDPSQLLCTPVECPMIAHNNVMYRDSSHLSATYSAQLAPKLAVVMEAAMKTPPG